MKVALIGYGKMGQTIHKLALERSIEIKAIIDPKHPEAHSKTLDSSLLKKCDVVIDFSHPESVIHTVSQLVELKLPIVMGTTGWYEHISKLKEMVQQARSAFIYSGNFSIGVYLFSKIIEASASLMDVFPDYDVAGLEMHHNQKVDRPSGTAQQLANLLETHIKRKTTTVFNSPNKQIKPHEIDFPSIRVGHECGTHQIIYDSLADSITLTHRARNRDGFALGALTAAEWIQDKQGFFTIDDLLEDKITRKH